MLSEEIANKLSERVTQRITNLNTYIIKQIAGTIKKIGELTPTKARQLESILKYGGSYEKITKEIARITNLNIKDIQEMFEKVAIKDQQFAKQFYKYRNIDYIPYAENYILQNHVNTLARTTIENYLNISHTEALGYGLVNNKGKVIYRGLRETYNNIIDEGIMSIQQGKDTFNQEMNRIIKSIGENGLRVIYPTTYIDKYGQEQHYTRRLDSAVRMNIQDGLKELHNSNQELLGNEFGSDGVEISVHENPAVDHEMVQGKQFSTIKANETEKSEWEKLQDGEIAKDYEGNSYTLDHDGKKGYRPISTMNCYHYIFSIVLGVSKPAYSNKELQEIRERNDKGFEYEGKHYTMYEGEQLQRRIELELRKEKDKQIMYRTADMREDAEYSQVRINVLTRKYKELLDASNLPSKLQRAKISGYRKISIKNI